MACKPPCRLVHPCLVNPLLSAPQQRQQLLGSTSAFPSLRTLTINLFVPAHTAALGYRRQHQKPADGSKLPAGLRCRAGCV